MVINAIFDARFTTDPDGRRQLTPEGLLWAAEDDRVPAPQRVPRHCRLHGQPVHARPRVQGVRRGREGPHHDPGQGRPPRLRPARPRFHPPSTSPAPNRVWVADYTYVRTWLGFVCVAFILDVFAQRIIAWHAATSKVAELVMIPLRMALCQRGGASRWPNPSCGETANGSCEYDKTMWAE